MSAIIFTNVVKHEMPKSDGNGARVEVELPPIEECYLVRRKPIVYWNEENNK